MSQLAVVTGALGNVGAAVTKALIDQGHSVRVADRSPQDLNNRFGGRAEIVNLDLFDHSTFGRVLQGGTKLFLIRPPAISRVGPTINPFIDEAARQGVTHVVFSSVAGADSNRIVPHHRIERHLMGSAMTWTMLRPGFFSQNIGTAYRRDIVEDDRIYVPAADGLAAFIDARDIGEVAALCLTEDGHERKEYHLTGPEALSFDQVAEMLTQILGRPIQYEAAGAIGYLRHLRQQGLVVPHAMVQTLLHVGLRRGDAEQVTGTIQELLGRPARSLAQYLSDHVELWQKPVL